MREVFLASARPVPSLRRWRRAKKLIQRLALGLEAHRAALGQPRAKPWVFWQEFALALKGNAVKDF